MSSSIPIQEFERAYRREAAYVAALMGRLCVPDEAIKDAVQDVFVAAYRRWPDFDESRPVRPWLTGFARHVAFRYRRSAARRHRRGLALAVECGDQAEPGPHHQTHARDFLTRFLAGMSPGHREAFLLSEYDGLTGPEIAEVLGISAEAAYGRVRAARRRLKQALMDDVGRGDPHAAAFVPPWGLVLARLQSDVPAATATTAASTGTATVAFKVTGLAVACAAALVVVSGAHHPSSRTPVEVAERAKATPQRAVWSSAEPTAAVRPPLEVTVPTPAPTHAAPSGAGPERSARSRERSPVARPPAVETESTHPEASASMELPSSETTGSLADEAQLLRGAKRALSDGDARLALWRLAEHARSFPGGQLADARERAQIRALCDLGRVDDARALASRMVLARPGDPLARQALSICSTVPIHNGARPENQRL